MNRNLTLYIAIALIGISSCTKSTSPAVTTFITSDTNYVFENVSTVALHVDMYSSYNDLINETNVIFSGLAPAKGVYKIPLSKLDTTANYFYDIYSPDFLYSNWGNYYSQGYSLLTQDHTFEIDTFNLTHARYYYLNGNNASTTWKAVDVRYSNNTSEWSTLDANGRYMTLVLNRNMSGTVNTKQEDGTPVTATILQLTANNNSNNGLTMMSLTTNTSSYDYLYNSAIVPGYNYYSQTSRDTLILYDEDYYWILARQ